MTPAPQERSRGAVIGSYELVERIGAGGMGEVWKARDRLLDRVVALKFLGANAPPSHDLLHEARAASSLNHPNIVTVFQVGDSGGESYLAMEFVEGDSLRRWIGGEPDIGEALDISEQIISGLASAHARGIIHRDLKPENIMIRGDGRVKLVDFGLAKRLALDDASTSAGMPAAARQSGELIGTCSYMSPEQARGKSVSTASDVFSLGIVMYELFSGRHPFRRDEVLDTLQAIVREAPPPLAPPAAPQGVAEIVSKSLHKEPSARYSSAVEISEPIQQARREWDLDTTRQSAPVPVSRTAPVWGRAAAAAVLLTILSAAGWAMFGSPASAGASAQSIRSVVVLPFRSPDPHAELFVEALPEDLGGALARAGFQVASRTSTLQVGSAPDVRAAALALGVDGVVEGSVRVQGAAVRIYVELVDPRTGFQLWSTAHTVDSTTLVSGQSAAATEIANQIRAAAGGRP